MLDLEAIELIKQLKARYFRCIDTCDLAGLKNTVFTADARIHFKSPTYEIQFQGWPDLEKFYKSSFTQNRFGMHHGHHPEISPNGDKASGRWYLHDIFINLEEKSIYEGSAIYEDDYVKVGNDWRIKDSRYDRLLEFIRPVPDDMRITAKPTRFL
jgi:hypothetical protein